MLTVTLCTPGTMRHGVLDPARHFAGDRAAGRGQRHVDGDVAVVVDLDPVDQAELVDVGRDFRIVDGLERGDDIVGHPLDFIRRDGGAGAVGMARSAVGIGHGWASVTERHSAQPEATPAAFRKASARRVDFLERIVEAEGGAAGRGHAIAGEERLAQWVPARTATPWRSITVATSWAWAPFISKAMIAPLPGAGR